jgi:hypothetical protein
MIINKFPLYYKCAIYFELCFFFYQTDKTKKQTKIHKHKQIQMFELSKKICSTSFNYLLISETPLLIINDTP